MTRLYNTYIPGNIGEVLEYMSYIFLKAPKFEDNSGYFPEENIETAFYALNEGLRRLQGKLGQERYVKLIDLSNQMRAYFEADPEDKTGDTAKGCKLNYEMRDILKQRVRRS